MQRNDQGYRVGEDHHRSTIPDSVVHELRTLHEHKHLRYQQLIELFAGRGVQLRYSWVRKVCSYHIRNCLPQ